jgi:hypothetical protein
MAATLDDHMRAGGNPGSGIKLPELVIFLVWENFILFDQVPLRIPDCIE